MHLVLSEFCAYKKEQNIAKKECLLYTVREYIGDNILAQLKRQVIIMLNEEKQFEDYLFQKTTSLRREKLVGTTPKG
jgi:hypothetical protein